MYKSRSERGASYPNVPLCSDGKIRLKKNLKKDRVFDQKKGRRERKEDLHRLQLISIQGRPSPKPNSFKFPPCFRKSYKSPYFSEIYVFWLICCFASPYFDHDACIMPYTY